MKERERKDQSETFLCDDKSNPLKAVILTSSKLLDTGVTFQNCKCVVTYEDQILLEDLDIFNSIFLDICVNSLLKQHKI